MAQPSPIRSTPEELKARIEAERAGEAFVFYRDADGTQRILRLGEFGDELTVGRGVEADICLGWDSRASRVHAEMRRVAGEWTIADDGLSRNGTWLNDERISGRRRLHDGDLLRIGQTLISYRAPTEQHDTATSFGHDIPVHATLSDTQRRVLVELCRPFADSGTFATPATNQHIADALFLSVEAIKTHLRTLFQKFEIQDLPQNQKRLRLVELALQSGAVTDRDLRT